MTVMVNFGVFLPNVAFDSQLLKPKEIVEYAVRAEGFGFDSVWVEDRLLHPLPVLEPFNLLAYVAARTEKVKLGTCVLLANLRNPVMLAKMLSTLNYLSGERLILGTSLGGRPEEYDGAGVRMKTRVSVFEETLAIMRKFWSQDRTDFESKRFKLKAAEMWPKPLPGSIPIWVGGKADQVLDRVGRIGDGWLATSMMDAAEFRQRWRKVEESARRVGRDPSALEPAKFVYLHSDPDRERAKKVLADQLPRYYGMQYDVERFALYGPAEESVERAKELLKAGVKTLIFSPVQFDLNQLETCANEIVARIR